LTLEEPQPTRSVKRRTKEDVANAILSELSYYPQTKTSVFGKVGISWEAKIIWDSLLGQGLIVEVPDSNRNGPRKRKYGGLFTVTKKGLDAIAHYKTLRVLYGVIPPSTPHPEV
jgi:predicted transcriptional regulator